MLKATSPKNPVFPLVALNLAVVYQVLRKLMNTYIKSKGNEMWLVPHAANSCLCVSIAL